jgi:hypothetical protein
MVGILSDIIEIYSSASIINVPRILTDRCAFLLLGYTSDC